MKKISPLKYIGGKHFMAKHIISLLRYDFPCYIEPFFGGGNVFFQKEPHKVEVINDLNDDLINFYRVWATKKDELIQALDALPYARKIYNQFKEEWKKEYKGKNDIDKAVRFLWAINCSFAGKFWGGWGYTYDYNMAKTYKKRIKRLDLLYHRIKNAQIECKDAIELLKNLKPKTKAVIYCDPPYFGVENYYHGNYFTQKDHERLAQVLNSLDDNKQVLISYYHFDGIENLYPPNLWDYKYFEQTKHSKGIVSKDINKRPKSLELLLVKKSLNLEDLL